MLMRAMADYITSTGIAKGFHEPPPVLERADLPAVVLFWDGDEGTTITPDHRGDMWLPVIRARFYGAAQEGDTPQEFSIINSRITPLVDAFHGAGLPNMYLSELDGHVDRLRVTRIQPSLELGYANQQYLGADLFFSAKFHRQYEEQ